MKKIFGFAVVAVLCLSMLASCKNNKAVEATSDVDSTAVEMPDSTLAVADSVATADTLFVE